MTKTLGFRKNREGDTVLGIAESKLKGHVPDGILRRNVTPTGNVVVPEKGNGKHSIVNGMRRAGVRPHSK